MELQVGSTVSHYKILRQLGSGGMGVVYEGAQERPRRSVALKVILGGRHVDATTIRMFQREADSLARLKHPGLAEIKEVNGGEAQPYLVMEYVKGPTLDKVIPKEGLPADVALRYAILVADAIACAHAARIVHRDLKPTNIIVDESGLVKVLDFGLAKVAVLGIAATAVETMTVGTTPGMIVGTVAYMSPEQAQGKAVDARSDVFSFGAVFYEMLSGHRAF